MSDRTFNIAGFSSLSGQRKVRFANGTVEARAKILERNGHVDIDLRELPRAMSKSEAMAFLEVTAEDVRAPKGVQAAAAKARKGVKVAEVIAIAKDAGKARAKEAAEEIAA